MKQLDNQDVAFKTISIEIQQRRQENRIKFEMRLPVEFKFEQTIDL